MSGVRELTDAVERAVGTKIEAERRLAALKEAANANKGAISNLEEARAIIQAVAQETQQGLEYRLGELVSLALASVFPEPYQLKVAFEARRGRTEVDVRLVDAAGNELRPMDAVGGGVADVAAFALRVCVWSLHHPRPRAVMVLDEPFRFLSVDLQERAAAMLRELSERLGMQFIIVTHEDTLASESPIRVARVRGKSVILRRPDARKGPHADHKTSR